MSPNSIGATSGTAAGIFAGSAIADVDAEFPGYRLASGVSGNFSSFGSRTLDNPMTLYSGSLCAGQIAAEAPPTSHCFCRSGFSRDEAQTNRCRTSLEDHETLYPDVSVQIQEAVRPRRRRHSPLAPPISGPCHAS